MVFISFGCSTDIFSFGKSFLTGPLQAVPKSNIVRSVCEKYFFIVQIVIDVFYLCVGLGVALQ